ncbi:hypothetical protein [Rhodoligotrophos defluvii]|uniref:hypothetical protein n=1 Tax=Rhodoligotrophos defluvii TaxID=2561934 RepID=UPI0010C97A6B|nr:hypothetical protein [Rhodoligotrophos defluvii]
MAGLFALFTGGLLAAYFAPHPELLFGGNDEARDFGRTEVLTLHDARLSIPRPYVLQVSRRIFGSVTRVTLQIPWPFAAGVPADGRDGADLEHLVTIELAGRTPLASATERLTRIYPVYFDGPGEAIEAGLTRYRFKPGSPYRAMHLYVGQAEPQGEPVLFHCAVEDGSAISPLCERRLDLTDKVTAVYRFHQRHLTQWQSLEATIADLLRRLRTDTGAPAS